MPISISVRGLRQREELLEHLVQAVRHALRGLHRTAAPVEAELDRVGVGRPMQRCTLIARTNDGKELRVESVAPNARDAISRASMTLERRLTLAA